MRQPASLLQGLEQAGILAVLRAPSAEHAVRAVDALVAGGVLGIEITYSTPGRCRRHRGGGAQTWGRHLPGRRHRVDSRPGPRGSGGGRDLLSQSRHRRGCRSGHERDRGCRLRWRSYAQRGDGSPASRRGCGQDLPCFARRSGVLEGAARAIPRRGVHAHRWRQRGQYQRLAGCRGCSGGRR